LIAEAVIVGIAENSVDGTTEQSVAEEESRRGGREFGPIRLPMKNAGDFILKFNQHYRSLGLQLQRQRNEKVPDSRKTAGDLNDESSSSATDHRT
jgi:hypothetical protein